MGWIAGGTLIAFAAGAVWGAVGDARRRAEAEAATEAERAADAARFERWRAENPRDAATLGAMELGPRYDTAPVWRVTSPVPWTRPGVGSPAACPACGATEYLALMWLESRPAGARFVCPVDGSAWVDPGWAHAEALAWVREWSQGPAAERWETTPDGVPPATWALVERMRREDQGDAGVG
ncbi:hypothetical protein SAMN05421803_14912 [Nocardiopsis flavescens]|uniref:Uncharacterized protein n=1 Tax=Nocardiopsis flavescens TaxID=758803 RepID=A0A1M6WR61_9ACTN|nr:hypothetical protein [Nocardiopsis flavescens]SHK96250.1 hypothetical protein SAMN05421803_14912 [Nocardiopsis flavescens]